MATIDPRNPATNPQLAGILNAVPMPVSHLSPTSTVNVGSLDGASFSLPTLAPAAVGGQAIVGGGGGASPVAGAQPAPPSGAVTTTLPIAATAPAPVASTAPASTSTAAATGTTGSPLAEAISGFGKASRGEPIRASIDGATFGFPSFKASAKSDKAPAIQWGPGWKKVERDGMWYMEHSNGSKAVPAVEYRITPTPAGKLQTIRMNNGWGKRFPDGSVLVFDRTQKGPYLLDPKGNKKQVGLGTITVSGIKVRVFEASVVRTIDKDGKVDVFDSRGNRSTGATRWRTAAPVGAADAGASMGGGKASEGGGAPGKAATTTVDLTGNVQKLTEVARGLVDEIRSGNVDPAKLASLQAQLAALPSGILQAAGAAGTITSDGGTTSTAAQPPAPGETSGGGGEVVAPTPGVDANATSKQLAAGASAKLDPAAIPSELRGMQARFAQLPDELQVAVAKAFGSTQGSKAFAPDRLVAFDAGGAVRVVEAGLVYTRHQSQVRGAGPGEDMVMTMRPGRQPSATGAKASVQGSRAPGAAAGGGGSAAAPAPASGPATTTPVVGSGAAGSSREIQLFKPGGELRHENLGGLDGTYTWRTLPAKARAVITSLLRSGSEVPAAKAFASRTGTGWVIDPNAPIVVEAGYASFPNGLSIVKGAASGGGGATPPTGVATPANAGPSNQSGAHDATRPPVPVSGGGGGTGAAPAAPPPAPVVSDPGEVGNGAHAAHARRA